MCVLKHKVPIHTRVTSCFVFFKEIIHTYLELHLAHSKSSINASHLPFHYCLLLLIWQVWGLLYSAFHTASRTSFSTMLPILPAILAFLLFLRDTTYSFLPQTLVCAVPSAWNRLVPNIYMTPSPFNLCSDVTFSGRMALTTGNLPALPQDSIFPFPAFSFLWSTTILHQSVSFTLLLNLSVFPLQECKAHEELCALNSGQHMMGAQ